jgi:UDP-N-acetylglucosamine 2-epimerase (non-hydrolysing)
MLIHLICAARPNFMKIAPLYHSLNKEDWANPIIVHTGQHYELNMSDVFFQDLGLPSPHIHLGIGSGTHAEQTGRVMMAYEKVLFENHPDLVIVVGDVNSTMACTLATVKMNDASLKAKIISRNELSAMNYELERPLVAHLEAGLRSFDRTMPEEINRIVTDGVADILWTPSEDAVQNLIREGIDSDKIVNVGNIMLDSLEMMRAKIEKQHSYLDFDLESNGYGVVTLHRPSNVDDSEVLRSLCNILVQIAEKIPLVFPIHPRTRKNLQQNGLMSIIDDCRGLFLPKPVSYINFMNLVFNCRFVITDSGGIQEETTYLNIPCLTVRPNTERPITITHGTNQLCGISDLRDKAEAVLSGYISNGKRIQFWDGNTSERIVQFLGNLRWE